jgi:pilus assembly protein FimV
MLRPPGNVLSPQPTLYVANYAFKHSPQDRVVCVENTDQAVASAVFLSSSAYAAGLGKLTVLSSLGQPLRAEIELTAVSNDEAGGCCSPSWPRRGLPPREHRIQSRPAVAALSVEQRAGRQFIKITSSQPLNEPFVDMLLELSWNSGRMVREYTFLLDPAELRTSQSPQVSPPVDVLSQGARPQAGSNYRPAAKPATPAAAPAAPAAQPKPEQAPSESKPRPSTRSRPAIRWARSRANSSRSTYRST